MRFFFLLAALGEVSGDGPGEDFFFFGEAETLGEGVSVGVGLLAPFFFADADFSAIAVGFGVGDFSAFDFFFVCLRGAGVGVGTKIFLSLVPIDSSADAGDARFGKIAMQPRTVITAHTRRMASDSSTSVP